MLIDGRSLPDGTTIPLDLCIVGGGPAGLALARELLGAPLQIGLVESGDVVFDPTLQRLNELEPGGTPLEPGADTRRRQLGGMANLWNTYIQRNQAAARYLPLDAIDFEQRDWLPHSGWPFSRADLDPYYRRAAAQIGFGSELDGAGSIGAVRPLPLEPTVFTLTLERFQTAAGFTDAAVEMARRSDRWTVLTRSTVTEIVLASDGRSVDHLRVQSDAARGFTILPRYVVLATGAIENARLLLVSNRQRPAGVGNEHDLVGRYYMDHHRVNGGRLIPASPLLFARTQAYDLRRYDGQYRMGKITLADETLRREHLLNISTLLWPRPAAEMDQAVDAIGPFLRAVRRGSPQALAIGRQVVGGWRYLLGTGVPLMWQQRRLHPDISRGGWSQLRRNAQRFTSFEIVHQCEQRPAPENRVQLGRTRDALGQLRAVVRLRWSELDIASIRRAQALLAEHVCRAGIGRIIAPPFADDPELHGPPGIHHHMGTTRMHADPRQGVVAADLRVHGLGNLYIAGSSTFPTGGYANPTLTIVALSIRLADQLRAVMTGGAASTV